MNLADLQDLKQLAMQAELARPLTHECNNFLNNLMLQLAISDKLFPDSIRSEWANVRRDGKKLAALLHQWQHQRTQPAEGPAKIDLNQLIKEVVEEVRLESASIRLHFHSARPPIWISGYTGEVQRLVSLLLRYAIDALEASGIEVSEVEIKLARDRDRVLLHLRNAEPVAMDLPWADFDDAAPSERANLSLPALTCKSLVERLNGEIRIENDATNGVCLTVDLPLATS